MHRLSSSSAELARGRSTISDNHRCGHRATARPGEVLATGARVPRQDRRCTDDGWTSELGAHQAQQLTGAVSSAPARPATLYRRQLGPTGPVAAVPAHPLVRAAPVGGPPPPPPSGTGSGPSGRSRSRCPWSVLVRPRSLSSPASPPAPSPRCTSTPEAGARRRDDDSARRPRSTTVSCPSAARRDPSGTARRREARHGTRRPDDVGLRRITAPCGATRTRVSSAPRTADRRGRRRPCNPDRSRRRRPTLTGAARLRVDVELCRTTVSG